MLAHSGIIMFKKGNKKAGLNFFEGLSPYDFPYSLFSFLSLFQSQNFSESFNNYFDALTVVSIDSEINAEDMKMLTKAQENQTWKKLSLNYSPNQSVLLDILFSGSFTELPDVSTLIVPEDESDLSFVNHVFEIDLDENTVSHFIGGIGFNFCRTLCFEMQFSEISEDMDINKEFALAKYSELLKKEYGTIE